MEIYYTSKVKGRTGSVAAWSKAPGFPPVLAAALLPSSVGIYNEEGRPLDPNKEALIANVRGKECMRLAWHPILPLLAIGWKDGAISFWNFEDRHMEEDSKTHRSGVTCLIWSAAGDRLMSADENGKLSIWKTDRLMRPIHVVSYEEQPGCSVRIVTLGPLEPNPDTGTVATTVYYCVESEGRTVIKWANDQGYQGLVQDMGELVTGLIFYSDKEQLVVVGASCSLYLLAHSPDGAAAEWTVLSKMKFATATGEAAGSLQVCWAGEHTLASASEKDNVVRMYNFDTEDNYILQVDSTEGTGNVTRVASLASDNRYGFLAAGTSDGRVTVFKYVEPNKDGEPILDFAKCWEVQPAFSVDSKATAMEWGPNPRLMGVTCSESIFVCRKTMLKQCFRDGLTAIQAGVDKVLVESLESAGKVAPQKVQLQMQLLGMDLSKNSLLVYDGSKAEVYKISDSNECTLSGGFDTFTRAMAINNDSIYRAAENRLEVCNIQGTVKQTLLFDDISGGPVIVDCNRDYLAAATASHSLRVFKIAGREAKPHQGPGAMLPVDTVGSLPLKVDLLRVNSAGTMVAALCSSKEKSRETRLFVHCFENQKTLMYDFEKDNRLPQVLAWDIVESKVLAVQTLALQRSVDDVLGGDQVSTEVALLFVSPDHGILLQEYQALDGTGAKGFISIQAPHLILNKPVLVTGQGAHGGMPPFTSNVARVLMQGFAGMQEGDDSIKSALLDFSYHLATGNMDEAFRAVKSIKNPAVWENMAHLCIKNKRLDVAEHCLGNMEHTRGARAVREAKSIEELDARVATVAVHLGMMDDARKLYVAAERFDLLNKLYQACGLWEKALEVAEKNDRIHLRTTHYSFAQHLEKIGDFEGAVKHYEASNCGPVEVTRMYFQASMTAELETYITKQGDNKQLTVWWARYCESRGDIKRALTCYEKAGDALSIVRIHCYTKNFSAAEEQVARLGDPAAAFHLARQYEAAGKISEAIKFFAQAKRYSHGVRLAKSNELDGDLVNLALKSTPAVMVDAADYLNEKGEHERAAMLYMKGGKMSKAVEMCFQAQLFDVLQHITDDMGANGADPELFSRCAEFFMQHEHNDKAVKMLIAAKQYSRALELCVEHDVIITEEMAESMTPGKEGMAAEERNLVLQRIAKVAKRQGNYQLAAKKYTQANEKIKAMKALLRSGDTEKIVFFTNVSRQKEIYMMSANYLQTLNWHSEPEIMKNIIAFYNKAQAMDSIAAFYEACAQIEIDEFRDYEKALQAMREAMKYLAKSKREDKDTRLGQVQHRIETTEKFVVARSLISTQPQKALSLCNDLLISISHVSQDMEAGIRVGDVYALMVEYWYGAGNALEAYKQIEQMRARSIILSPYLDQRMVDDIYKTLGVEPVADRVPANRGIGYGGGQGDGGEQGYGAGDGYVDEDDGIIDEAVPDMDD